MDRIYRILAFVGGYLVASNSVSMDQLAAVVGDLLTSINTIAGLLIALSPDGMSAAKAVASKMKSDDPAT